MINEILANLSNETIKILTNFGYGLCLCESNFKIIWCNRVFEEWFLENKDKTIYQVIEEKDSSENSLIINSIQKNKATKIELFNPSSDRWFLVNVIEFSSQIDDKKYFFFLLDDTTEKKQVFENFISQLEILDNVEDGIYSTDFENRIIYWNKGAEKIYGYSASEVIGKIINKDITLYDQPDPETQIQIIQELEKYRTYYFKRKEYRKGGLEIWIEGNVTLVSDTGDKPAGLIYIVRDVTGKLVSETLNYLNANLQKSLREITANLLNDFTFSDILLQLSKKCKELTESRFCAIFKVTEHKSEILDIQIDKILSDEDHKKLLNISQSIRSWLELNKTVLSSFDNSAPEILFELNQIFKLDIFIIAPVIIKNEVNCFIMVGAENYFLPRYKTEILISFASLLSFIMSYFDKKILQETLEEKIKQIQKFELTSNLISGVVHDFKNLLNGIQATIDLIKSKYSDSLPTPILNEIENLILRGLELSKSLLEINKPLKPSKTIFKLHKLLNEIFTLAQRICPENIKVLKEFDELPEVYADYSQLHQVFVNLIMNAKDAMPDGGILKIETEFVHITEKDFILNPKLKSGNYVVVKVEDTGIGIPKEHIQKIFEPFYTTKETRKGTGLGLFISQNIVNRHNGYIEVESTPGKGTTFKVYLPILEEDLRIEEKTLMHIIKSKPTILLIDDEVTIRSLLSEMLSYQNFAVVEGGSGEEALNLFEKFKNEIDLVIVDYYLKDMTGADVIKKIRSINENIPIFVATGIIDEVIEEKLKTLKVDKIIEKPYEFDALLASINNYIQVSSG